MLFDIEAALAKVRQQRENAERAVPVAEATGRVFNVSPIQSEIQDWADATFGKATVESTVKRIDQELAEFFKNPVKEATDIAIMLYRLAAVAGFDLDEAVAVKMVVNKSRTWVTAGDGQGQHVGSKAKAGPRDEAAKQLALLEALLELHKGWQLMASPLTDEEYVEVIKQREAAVERALVEYVKEPS